ncbi:MAG: aspartate kinase [Polaromonas sp.]|nr:aspartate kinase [Polaromonas sp.]
MWVVKISGRLNKDPMLPLWLEMLVQLGGGRVTVVCGGGNFAEEARRAHSHWRFDNNLQAHNMAVLSVAQAAYLALGLEPRLHLAASESDIRRILRGGHTALWLPIESLRQRPDAETSAGGTADYMALHLAGRLNAEQLIMVKAEADDASAGVSDPGRTRVLHRSFESTAKRVGLPIAIVHSRDLERVRSLLHGGTKRIDAS